MGDVVRQSSLLFEGSRAAAPWERNAANPDGARCHRHLDCTLAQDPPQGPDCALWLRSAASLRNLGTTTLYRQPRQGVDGVSHALPRVDRPGGFRGAPARSAPATTRT